MTDPYYTLGVWTVKPGREEEFIAGWEAFGRWSFEALPETRWGRLLRDLNQPNRFISFGPWGSLDEIERWRAHPGFAEQMKRLSEVLESFEPGTYKRITDLTPPGEKR